jgi:sulfur relay (sulfurtransferase) DsrF/TusC family protein
LKNKVCYQNSKSPVACKIKFVTATSHHGSNQGAEALDSTFRTTATADAIRLVDAALALAAGIWPMA